MYSVSRVSNCHFSLYFFLLLVRITCIGPELLIFDLNLEHFFFCFFFVLSDVEDTAQCKK